MKKVLSLLVVAVMLLLLTSCGGNKYDALTVAKNLGEKNYYVQVAVDEEDIASVL